MSKRLQRVMFKLSSSLVPRTTYRLRFKYTAPISSKTFGGIFQSKHENADGETR